VNEHDLCHALLLWAERWQLRSHLGNGTCDDSVKGRRQRWWPIFERFGLAAVAAPATTMLTWEACVTTEPVPATILAVRLAVVSNALPKVRALHTVVVKLTRIELKLAMTQPRDVDVAFAFLALHRRTPSAVFFDFNATACRLVEYIGNRHRKRCRAVVAMTAPNNILQRRLVCEDDVTEQDALFEAWVGIFGRVHAQPKVLNHQLVHLLARELRKGQFGDVYEDVFIESEKGRVLCEATVVTHKEGALNCSQLPLDTTGPHTLALLGCQGKWGRCGKDE
jgi:hypothetical protein